MKKLLIGIACLFLSSCTMRENSRDYVKCWDRVHQENVVFEGYAINGVGWAASNDGKAVLTFKTESGDRVIIKLNDKMCAIVATK